MDTEKNQEVQEEVGAAPAEAASGDSLRSSLLPCPFCGKKALVELTKVRHCQLHGEPYQNTIIRCAGRCASVEMGSLELAAREWNRRLSPEAAGLPKPSPAEGPSQVTPTKAPVVDLEAIEYVIAVAKNSSGLSPTGEEKIIEAETALSQLRAALGKAGS